MSEHQNKSKTIKSELNHLYYIWDSNKFIRSFVSRRPPSSGSQQERVIELRFEGSEPRLFTSASLAVGAMPSHLASINLTLPLVRRIPCILLAYLATMRYNLPVFYKQCIHHGDYQRAGKSEFFNWDFLKNFNWNIKVMQLVNILLWYFSFWLFVKAWKCFWT